MGKGGRKRYFSYGEKETDYLKSRDEMLAGVIEQVGHIDREMDTDLFSAVVHHAVLWNDFPKGRVSH